MLLYRIVDKAYANDLSGEGSRLFGGRWNPAGRPVLYTAESPSLAMLEMMAICALNGAPPDLVLVTIEIPENVTIEKPDLAALPSGWDSRPPKSSTANYGLKWLDDATACCLVVPSVIAPVGYGWNYLLNPLHPELTGNIKLVESVDWTIDSRIMDKISAK